LINRLIGPYTKIKTLSGRRWRNCHPVGHRNYPASAESSSSHARKESPGREPDL